MNAIPGWFRTLFRDEPEQDSGIKVNAEHFKQRADE